VLAVAERSIAGADLMGTLPQVLEQIDHQGTVFLVNMGKVSESSRIISGLLSAAGEIVFALGPAHVIGGVFGLIDEEYGWPHPIQIAEVKTVADLMPGRRRHPMIYRGEDCLAMSISLWEYEQLKRK
jgi:hypothetical protein